MHLNLIDDFCMKEIIDQISSQRFLGHLKYKTGP